ncbi:MAG: hypothetical protein WCW52_00885 [Elusimicrobiales bacterium]|jgi:hypothetical protein
MKYILAIVTLAAFTSLSFAQAPAAPATEPVKAAAPKVEKKAPKKEMKKMEIVTGTISAIDTAANSITVKDEKGADKVLSVDAAKLATLKVGESVKIKVRDNKAEMIKTIRKHEGKKAEAKK